MNIPFYVEYNGEKINRGIIPFKELPNKIREASKNNIELYFSYYLFDNEANLHKASGRKTLEGFKGNVYFRKIILDIDKKTDSEDFCLRRAREFAYRINSDYDIPYESMQYYFSGTGFHIVLPDIFKFDPSPTLPLLVKYNFEKLFPESDIMPFTSHRSLIRAPHTINSKVSLFKIPLSTDEFFKMDYAYFQREAKENRLGFKHETEPYSKDWTHLIEKVPAIAITSDDSIKKHEEDSIATCISNMYYEGALKGTNRHNKILRMVSAWRRAGVPRPAILFSLTQWANTLDPYEVKRLVDNVYEKSYAYGCNDTMMSSYCSDKCIFHKKRNFTVNIITTKEAEQTFVDFVRSDYEDKSFDMNEVFTGGYSYKFLPGEVFGIQGGTKLGKSAVIENMAVELKRINSIYCTFENGINLTYRRLIQIAHNMSKEQVIQYYKTYDNSLSKDIDHIKLLSLPPTLEQLDKLIIDHNPKLVIIDTLGDIDVPGVTDMTAKTGILAPRLKEIANRRGVIIGCILHVGKAESAPDYKTGKTRQLTVHSNIGSSAVAQKFDKILSWEGEREGMYRTLTASASRDEGELKLNLRFDKHTFKMELTNE